MTTESSWLNKKDGVDSSDVHIQVKVETLLKLTFESFEKIVK